jgi:hypothetical protein
LIERWGITAQAPLGREQYIGTGICCEFNGVADGLDVQLDIAEDGDLRPRDANLRKYKVARSTTFSLLLSYRYYGIDHASKTTSMMIYAPIRATCNLHNART